MVKIKRLRTADCVVGGFRYGSKGHHVGSLLLGLYNSAGKLDHVGFTASFRAEVQQTHPGIQFSLVSPGVVWTEFGRNARHGGPDSRQLPDGQEPAEVAEVIAGVIETRRPDVYTRAGSHDRVVAYFDKVGVDP